MKDAIQRFDNMFNCPNCKKTLWRYKKLPDGRCVCISCYDLNMKNKNIKQKMQYIELTSEKLINDDLSKVIYDFFEKVYYKNPIESEIVKLLKLFYLQYKQDIDYDVFFDVINNVYNSVKLKKSLN